MEDYLSILHPNSEPSVRELLARVGALERSDQKLALRGGDAVGYDSAGKISYINADRITVGTLNADRISVGAIGNTKLADGAVTGAKIAQTTITGNKIVTGTITGNLIAAYTITGNNIAANTITADKIAANYISVGGAASDVNSGGTEISPGKILISGNTQLADWRHGSDATKIDGGAIYANSVTANQIAAGSITAEKIQAGTITVDKLSTGAFSVGGTNQPGYIYLRRGGSQSQGDAYLRWEGGSQIWSDSSNYMGFMASGERFYFYTGGTLYAYFSRGSQAQFYTGVNTGGNLNVSSGGNCRIESGKLWVDTYNSPSEDFFVGGDGKLEGNLSTNHHDPRSSNSYNLGGSSQYWAWVNCHDVAFHSMGWYDEGVTMPDGEKVSDVEAIKRLKPHKEFKAATGVPLIDKKSLPVEMFLPASDHEGNPHPRDPETGYPIVPVEDVTFDKKGKEIRKVHHEVMPDADGESGAQLLGLALGAIKELALRLDALEDNLTKVSKSPKI